MIESNDRIEVEIKTNNNSEKLAVQCKSTPQQHCANELKIEISFQKEKRFFINIKTVLILKIFKI